MPCFLGRVETTAKPMTVILITLNKITNGSMTHTVSYVCVDKSVQNKPNLKNCVTPQGLLFF